MAGTLVIEPVRTRAQLSAFIKLPHWLYAGIPGYVAPLDVDRRALLDPRRSSFFTHGFAAYWIARRDGVAVGRISAQIDLMADRASPPDLGLFGCLDAIDDGEVVASLLRQAEDWLRAHGRVLVRGPFLLSINGEAGLLTEGHLEPPMTMMGWHPVYLQAHLRVAGYAPAMQLFCYGGPMSAAPNIARFQNLAVHLENENLAVRDFRPDDPQDVERARRLFNEAWRGNWGFTPVSESDIRHMLSQFRPLLSSESGFFIEVAGEAAAFVLTLPNVFEIAQGLGPAPSPLGWIKLLYRIRRRRFRSYRLVIFGLSPKFHVLGARIGAAAIAEWLRRMNAVGAETVEAGWVLESNTSALRPVVATGARRVRTYAVYQKWLLN